MAITTKTGDQGRTSLYRGGMVMKDSLRVEICGTADELSAYLGSCKALCVRKDLKELLEVLQGYLFIVGAEIATLPRYLPELKRRITPQDVRMIEAALEQLEREKTFKENCFYISGSDQLSASLDIARTVARRLERRIVSLKGSGGLKNAQLLIFLNRLSDLLFLLARKSEKKHAPFLGKDFSGFINNSFTKIRGR